MSTTGGPEGDVGPSGTLDAEVIHKDGTETPVTPKPLLQRIFEAIFGD